jgi:hypothetical protein
MSENLAQLDELLESDIREALGEPLLDTKEETSKTEITNVPDDLITESSGEVIDDIGDMEILPMAEIESALEDEEENINTGSNVNMTELVSLLSKLLSNKTIEITIKIKD